MGVISVEYGTRKKIQNELEYSVDLAMYTVFLYFTITVEPLYSGHPWGTRQGWPLLRGCFAHKLFIWVPGRGGLYSGVAVKRGSKYFQVSWGSTSSVI